MKGHPIIAALVTFFVAAPVAMIIVNKLRDHDINSAGIDGIDVAMSAGSFIGTYLAYRHFK